MLNHIYASVKNANLVDCGKKQHIPSQPSPLLRDNYLGEYRTELDKKKVLANLGIATELSLEWEYIKGDIGRSEALMAELDSRTKYISKIDGFQKSVIEGINYLETVVGGEQEGEEEQNNRLTSLEKASQELSNSLTDLKTYIEETVDVNIDELTKNLDTVTEKVNNITNLIQVSTKAGNALILISEENPGLYVPDLSTEVTEASKNIETLQTDVKEILDTYVTKEELGGGDFDFVNQEDFDNYVEDTEEQLDKINEELEKTVKTGEDGHVDTLYVNKISKNNDDGNIIITDSFEVDSGIPLDVRFVVKNLEQLHSLKPLVCYAGMGVIVQDQASLYILREPANGIIDEEYIKDEQGINWKCPEDLIIEVLTQEEYDKKLEEGSISPHMFYYIHEEVVDEPIRDDYESDEAYTEALDKWLRVLQQKYMSAVWGQDIENLVASKASNTAIKSLETEIQRLSLLIDSLSGGSSGINLKDLNTQVEQNTQNINTLIKEDGTIPTLQKELSDLQTVVTNDYVTQESITVENPEVEYIFVKKSAFEAYTKEHSESIATQIATGQIIFGDNVLTSNESDLIFNDEKIALDKQIPVIELIDLEEFEALSSIDNEKYYYIYNDEERYVLDSEFTNYKTNQSRAISTLSDSINSNKISIGDLSILSTNNTNSLVNAINEVNAYVSQLSGDQDSILNDEFGLIPAIQKDIAALQSTLTNDYVTISSLTTEDPNVEYIFVKQSAFETYKTTHSEEIAESVNTKKLTTSEIVLGENSLNSSESDLLFNEEKVALSSQVPVIEVIDNSTFESLSEIDDNKYYYIYDDSDRYILDSEFTEYKTAQNGTITTLSENINKNQSLIGDLTNLNTDSNTTLVIAINELVSKINDLTTEIEELKEKIANLETV